MEKIEKKNYIQSSSENISATEILPSSSETFWKKAPIKSSGENLLSKIAPKDGEVTENNFTKSLTHKKYHEKILQIMRVTKVVKGGKRMSFRALVIVGDNQHKVGVGIGRAEDVGSAIQKAVINAKKNLITVPLTVGLSIPHTIKFSYGASSILLRPASPSTGVVASGVVGSILKLSGIKNVVAKQLGSSNMLNNAKAVILALQSLNEKIAQGQVQTSYRKAFYGRIMAKYKKNLLFT